MFPSQEEKFFVDAAGKLVNWTVILGTVLAVFGQKIGLVILKRAW